MGYGTMSRKDISLALSSHLNTLASKPPIAWENAQFTPTTGVLYLKETTLTAYTMPIGIGFTDSTDIAGIYQIDVNAPLNGSKVPALDMVDKLQAHFPRGLKLTRNAVTVEIGAADISQPRIDGNLYVISISIKWRTII